MDFKSHIDEFIKKYAKILTSNKKRKNLSPTTINNIKSIFKKDNDAIVLFDQFGVIKYYNDTFSKVLKHDKNNMQITSIYDLFAIGANIDFENGVLTINYENGFQKIFEVSEQVITIDEVHMLKLCLKDISTNMITIKKQKQNLEKMNALLHCIDDLIFSTDKEFFINYSLGESLLIQTNTAITDSNIYEVFPSSYCNEIKKTIKKGGSIFIYNYFDPKDTLVFETKITTYGDEYIFLTKNISHLKSMSNALNYLSSYDTLTGFLNYSNLKPALERISQYSYLPIGIEKVIITGMKNINKNISYEEGDKILRQISSKIKSAITGFDITCRISGDTLAVIFPNTSEQFLEKFRNKLNLFFKELMHKYEKYDITFEIDSLFLKDSDDNYYEKIDKFLR